MTSNHHEALFYSVDPAGVICELCPHFCRLSEGQTGICRTRRNIGNKLWSLAYGKPVAVHVDPIEKKPLYHFMPNTNSFSLGTAGCNLGCLNCQNWSISTKGTFETNHLSLPPNDVVTLALEHQCPSISYTYTDPVVFYEYMAEICIIAHNNGLRNVMVSAGYINPKPLNAIAKHLDAANIDLKTFDNKIYKSLNKTSLNEVLQTLIALKKNDVWLEITNLIIPGYTDNLETIERMCRWLMENGFGQTPLHFSRFIPMHKLKHLEPTPIETIDIAAQIATDCGLKYIYVGNVPHHRRQHTYCHGCGKPVIKREGYTTTNHLAPKGICPHCQTSLPGRWQ
jgi:pyruvate formate lyase activating enzyme